MPTTYQRIRSTVAEHVVLSLARGDTSCRTLFRISDITAGELMNLRASSLSELIKKAQEYFVISLDSTRFEQAVHQACYESHSSRIENGLLRAGAPFSLFLSHYGWNRTDYTTRRKELGLPGDAGRPRLPSLAEKNTVIDLYDTDIGLTSGRLPLELLRISNQSHISIDIIIAVLQEQLSLAFG